MLQLYVYMAAHAVVHGPQGSEQACLLGLLYIFAAADVGPVKH